MYKVGEKINKEDFKIAYPLEVMKTKEQEELSGKVSIPVEMVDENQKYEWMVNFGYEYTYVNNPKGLIFIDFSKVNNIKDIELVDENNRKIDYDVEWFDIPNKHALFQVKKKFKRDGTVQLKILCGKM